MKGNFTIKSILFLTFFLVNASLFAQTTTPDMGGTTFANLNTVGSEDWDNPSFAQTEDANFATRLDVLVALLTTTTNTTHYLTATGFDFSAIPAGATILGVTVKIHRLNQGLIALNAFVRDHSVKLLVGGNATGTEHATATDWTGTETTITYGGPTDTWGASLTPAIVKQANFGAAISADLIANAPISLGVTLTPAVNYISVAVTYQGGTLAINLQDFSAARQGDNNLLSWTASSNNPGDKFIVQHSADSRNWDNLATIPAVQDQHQYSYTDNNPASGPNFYRLYLENMDANGVYSTIQEINNRSVTATTCYPNPFISTINVSSPKPIHSYELKDIQGKTIQYGKPASSTNSLQLQAAGLPPGLYLLKVDETLFKLIKK